MINKDKNDINKIKFFRYNHHHHFYPSNCAYDYYYYYYYQDLRVVIFNSKLNYVY